MTNLDLGQLACQYDKRRFKIETLFKHLKSAGFYLHKTRLKHHTVCHSAKEWARDDDGDGINEVHTNTAEGLWTELRNFLRRFKGGSKHFIHLYITMFEWMHNLKKVKPKIIQAMTFSHLGT